jgi:hypothetical protein
MAHSSLSTRRLLMLAIVVVAVLILRIYLLRIVTEIEDWNTLSGIELVNCPGNVYAAFLCLKWLRLLP